MYRDTWHYEDTTKRSNGTKKFKQGTFVKNILDTEQPHLFFVARVLSGDYEYIYFDLIRLGFKGIVNKHDYVLVLFPIYHYDKKGYYSFGSHFKTARGSEIDSFEEISLDEARDIAKKSKDYKVISFLQNENVVDVLNFIPTKVEENIKFEFLRYGVLEVLAEKYLVVPLEYRRFHNGTGYGYVHAYEDEHRLDKLIHKYYKLKYKDDEQRREYIMQIAESVVNELDDATLAHLKEEAYRKNLLTYKLNSKESFYRKFINKHYKGSV